jgi:hypothetical protein
MLTKMEITYSSTSLFTRIFANDARIRSCGHAVALSVVLTVSESDVFKSRRRGRPRADEGRHVVGMLQLRPHSRALARGGSVSFFFKKSGSGWRWAVRGREPTEPGGRGPGEDWVTYLGHGEWRLEIWPCWRVFFFGIWPSNSRVFLVQKKISLSAKQFFYMYRSQI